MADESMWQTTGGQFEDLEMLIKDAEFGYRDDYNEGESELLIWTFDDSTGEEREHLISIGNGWDVADGGAKVESDLVELFHNSSLIGRYIERFLELGMQEVFKEDGRGDPRVASAYIGLKFHMKNEKKDFGGEIGVKGHLMPLEFLGVVGKGKAKAKTEEASADDAKAEKKAKLQLKKLASASDDSDEFQMAAIDLDLPDSLSSRVFDDDQCAALYEELTE